MALVNSRRVRRGDLFFALPGLKADGRAFVHQAFDNGAAAAPPTRRGERREARGSPTGRRTWQAGARPSAASDRAAARPALLRETTPSMRVYSEEEAFSGFNPA